MSNPFPSPPRRDDPRGKAQQIINTAAWAGAVEFACLSRSPEARAIRERYREVAGVSVEPLPPGRTPIDRMIDEACGGDLTERWPAFVEWFNREIWGEEWVPKKRAGATGPGSPTAESREALPRDIDPDPCLIRRAPGQKLGAARQCRPLVSPAHARQEGE